VTTSDDHLHAIEPFVPAVAVPPFVSVRKGRIALEARTRQIIEKHVEFRVEQILPTLRQVVEERAFMFEQSVEALVKFMDLHQFKTRTQKISDGAFLIPVAMKPPLAPGIDETVTAESLYYQIPSCPLAARGKPLCPEFVQTQLSVQRNCQPTCTELPWPAQFHLFEPDVYCLIIVDLTSTVLGKEGHRLC
jgi:hypothetical protein